VQEEAALRAGVAKHGLGAWEIIRKDLAFAVLRCGWRTLRGKMSAVCASFSSPKLSCLIHANFSTHRSHRTGVQLKDKFRKWVWANSLLGGITSPSLPPNSSLPNATAASSSFGISPMRSLEPSNQKAAGRGAVNTMRRVEVTGKGARSGKGAWDQKVQSRTCTCACDRMHVNRSMTRTPSASVLAGNEEGLQGLMGAQEQLAVGDSTPQLPGTDGADLQVRFMC
jgi:hypothetical protein